MRARLARAWRRLDAGYTWLIGSKEGFVVLLYASAILMLGWLVYADLTGRIS